MGRVLGVDVGDRRVGVALSDPERLLATALAVLDTRKGSAIDGILRLLRQHGAEECVVGLPLRADGSEGPAAAKVRRFGAELRARGAPSVVYWDERHTTVMADEALDLGRVHWRERKKVRDKLAAQLMLQGYLDASRG